MEVNGTRKIARSCSTRTSRRSNVSLPKSSYSSPTPSCAPRSPSTKEDVQRYYSEATVGSTNFYHQPQNVQGIRSPKVSLSSPSETERSLVDINKSTTPRSPRSPNIPRSPRSPKPLENNGSNGDMFNFDLQSPPKSKVFKKCKPEVYEALRSDSNHSIRSMSDYSKENRDVYHQTAVEYKVSHSLDSDTQTKSSSRYSTTTSTSSRTSSFKDKREKVRCNIHANPTYDEEAYASNKSLNEKTERPKIHRCRKSTSDLTDMTDDAGNTTMTSLSRPSSPRRKGSIKGGLAYLAYRRESRESIASNISNTSNEDIGPLNFQKYPRGRQRRTSNFLELPVPDHVRPRVCSLPEKAFNPRLSDDLYRLRTFSITNKGGVVNCGDSIINRRSRSNTSVNSTTSRASNVSGERSPFEGSCCGSGYHTVDSSPLGSPEEVEVPKYRVVMLGDAGVGKTALVSQFMTSEYMNTYDASLDDEFGERTVSILLDGEESEMIFIDHPSSEMSVENSLSTYEPHACVVVYSIVARASFQTAEDILNYLWREGYTQEKSVIVVGNKADLARSRAISENEGKALAVARDCKFIETSSGIQHNVDELLVGILKQIRLRETKLKKKQSTVKKDKNKLHGSKTSLSLNIAKEILQKICMNDISKSKSCENLHVL